jgi:hypothetical protein
MCHIKAETQSCGRMNLLLSDNFLLEHRLQIKLPSGILRDNTFAAFKLN